MDVDVPTTPDERGVGAMVDATDAESKKYMVIFVPNMSEKKKPFTTQTAINCMRMFYKTLFLKLFQVQRIFDTDVRQLSMFAGN